MMHLLYLDASGDPGWPPPYGRSNNKWYVLAGICLEEKTWDPVNEEFKQLVEKYFPDPSTKPGELKYSELHSGVPPYDQLSESERKQLADDIFELIIRWNPVLFATAINKKKHKERYGESAFSPVICSLRLIAPRFEKYLERIDGKGILVMDAEQSRREKKMRRLISEGRKYGIVLKSISNPFLTNTRLPRIVEGIMFVYSEDSPGIQLADFCSHATWLHFEKSKSDRFNQIEHLFDSHQGKIYGLKVWE